MLNQDCGRKALKGQNMERQDAVLQAKKSEKGTNLSPCSYKHIIQKTGLDSEEGGEIGGRNVNNLRYADEPS